MTMYKTETFVPIEGLMEGVEHGPSTPLFISNPEDPRATPEMFDWKLTHINTALRGIELDNRTYPPSEALDRDTVWKMQRVLYHLGKVGSDTSHLYSLDEVLASAGPIDDIWFTLHAIEKQNMAISRYTNPHQITIEELGKNIDAGRRRLIQCPVQLLSSVQASAPPDALATAYNRPVACKLVFCTMDPRVSPPSFELKPNGIIQAVDGNAHGCNMPLVDAMVHSPSKD
jgi:hypothetical protein